jgi:hypothetical protein
MLYGCPTCIVGQTSNGPFAGHGVLSTKLAAEPDVAVAPTMSAATAAMNAKRFKFLFLPGVSGTAAK